MAAWYRGLCIVVSLSAQLVWAQPAPAGEVKGSAFIHTAESARAAIQGAAVALPSSVTGGAVFVGAYRDIPKDIRGKAPVVVFLHGSSGLGLKAIGEWQRWLAEQGYASLAPDSFALPDRVSYTSPIGKDTYEKIHALRASEIPLALEAAKSAPWADTARLVLAGASEGAVAVARYQGEGVAGRMVFSWSCEDNYFVDAHRTAVPADQAVLNVISSTDPFFSKQNPWLGNAGATGHCAPVLTSHKRATVVLIPGAPHTLLNLPAARGATADFLGRLAGR